MSFFGNSSLVRPSWKVFAGFMIWCRANAPFTFDTVFFYLFWWWIFVKSLHMFSCFFSFAVSSGYRLSSNKWFDWNSLLRLLLCKKWIKHSVTFMCGKEHNFAKWQMDSSNLHFSLHESIKSAFIVYSYIHCSHPCRFFYVWACKSIVISRIVFIIFGLEGVCVYCAILFLI